MISCIAQVAGCRPGAVSVRRQAGFSLIEVLIALVVLALGLLGFALLQTMNLRYAQSSNYRTQATNLSYDLIDQIRANRALAGQYAIDAGSFGSVTGQNCSRPTAFVTPANSVSRWKCQVRAALGENATAAVQVVAGRVDVTINWSDARGEVGQVSTADDQYGSIQVGTQL
jgi:type IV pilus assembly protein PilV